MKTPALTDGPVSGHFFRLMLPLIAGDVLQQLYNTIDTLVIGRYAGTTEFAAVGVASSVMNLFLFALAGCCAGVSVLLGQAYGGGRLDTFRSYHFMSLVFGVAISLLGGIAGIVLMPALLDLLQTPAEILPHVQTYLSIVLTGYVISFLYNLYAALLRAIGQAKIALLALVIAVVLNLWLDVYLVAILKMGIAGAAVATVIAQLFSALACIAYVVIRKRPLMFTRSDRCITGGNLKLLVETSTATCFHQVSVYLGRLLIQGVINSAGTDIIAAYTVTTRIEGFANSFGISGSTATSVLVAQNYGAGQPDRVKKTFFFGLGTALVFGVISSLVLAFSAHFTVALVLGQTDGATFESACQYLQRVALFYVFCFTGNILAGYFKGLGRATIPFIGSATHLTLRVILSFLWVPVMGLTGVAYATGLGWILVNVLWASWLWWIQRGERRSFCATSL